MFVSIEFISCRTAIALIFLNNNDLTLQCEKSSVPYF
jgi:hypothetical protein